MKKIFSITLYLICLVFNLKSMALHKYIYWPHEGIKRVFVNLTPFYLKINATYSISYSGRTDLYTISVTIPPDEVRAILQETNDPNIYTIDIATTDNPFIRLHVVSPLTILSTEDNINLYSTFVFSSRRRKIFIHGTNFFMRILPNGIDIPTARAVYHFMNKSGPVILTQIYPRIPIPPVPQLDLTQTVHFSRRKEGELESLCKSARAKLESSRRTSSPRHVHFADEDEDTPYYHDYDSELL
jgi:hypothetical protein